MPRARTNKYGESREQSLQREVKQLKAALGQLRKQLARVDLDRFSVVREMIEEAQAHPKEEQNDRIVESLKKTWSCRECESHGESGVMEIFTYERNGKVFYYRICSQTPVCKNRTLAKEYSPNVVGIMRKDKVS